MEKLLGCADTVRCAENLCAVIGPSADRSALNKAKLNLIRAAYDLVVSDLSERPDDWVDWVVSCVDRTMLDKHTSEG